MSGSRLVLPSQQPVQSTGLPYAGGQLFFYVSGTTTPATTYADSALSTPNTNPVILDAAGDAGNVFLDPSVIYKVVLEDSSGDQIWTFDPVYPFALGSVQGLTFAGISTGSANAQGLPTIGTPFNGQTVIFVAGFTNTTSATLNNDLIYQQGNAGPAVLNGGEIQTGNAYAATFETALNSEQGGWQLIGAVSPLGLGADTALLPFFEAQTIEAAYIALGGYIPPPTGRLTLTTAVPVLSATVSGATSVLYTPYVGNQIPVWDAAASTWGVLAFAELTCTLSDATLSPAAAVAASVYDLYVWSNAGTLVLSRGPAWASATVRTIDNTRTRGVLVNNAPITNGPAAGFGVYVGTIATDPAAATVTFNPAPASASSGPSGGAWVGLWNEYSRVPLAAAIQDTNASWSYSTNTWRSADNSTNNRVTFVTGHKYDCIVAQYNCFVASANSSNVGGIGIGLDTTTASTTQTDANPANGGGLNVGLTILPQLGRHVIQALEISNIGATAYAGASGQMQLLAQLTY